MAWSLRRARARANEGAGGLGGKQRRLMVASLGLLWLAAFGAVAGLAGWLLWPRPTPLQVAAMPPLPRGLPQTLQLGLFSGPEGAADMRATAAFGFRYQYLAGGVNTGNGWATWGPDGSFVTDYMRDSYAHGMTPVFTYYMLTQSAPGRGDGPGDGDILTDRVAAGGEAADLGQHLASGQEALAVGLLQAGHLGPPAGHLQGQSARDAQVVLLPLTAEDRHGQRVVAVLGAIDQA